MKQSLMGLRKLIDNAKITNLGWEATTKLEEGLKIAYQDFLANPEVRL